MAIAFAAGTPNTIVVDISSDQAGIVLVRGGVPQVVNRLVFPEGNTSPQARADAVAGAVEQMAGYYQVFGSGDEGEALPVVLTGEVQDQGAVAQALQRVFQREVIPCAPALEYPDDFPTSEYAVNVGLALAFRATGKEGVVSRELTSVNQLPARHLPRPLPALPIAVFAALLGSGAGTLYAQQIEVTSVVDESTSLSEELAQAERRYDRIRKEANRLHGRSLLLRGLADGLQGRLNTVRSDLTDMLLRLDVITAQSLPPNVSIPGVAPEIDEFVVSGRALAYEDILQYAENLRSYEGLFHSVVVEGVKGSGIVVSSGFGEVGAAGEPLEFQIKIVINPPIDEEAEAALEALIQAELESGNGE